MEKWVAQNVAEKLRAGSAIYAVQLPKNMWKIISAAENTAYQNAKDAKRHSQNALAVVLKVWKPAKNQVEIKFLLFRLYSAK